jgi:hypothetical protein
MKNFRLLSVLLLSLIIISGCMRRDRFVVESDYSYRANFKKYNSFSFADRIHMVADSSMNNPIIEDAIRYRMELQGYKLTPKKPSLLVLYKVFYDDLKFQGYVQPELDMWLKNEAPKDENEDVAKGYDPVKYSLQNGTLLIQFLDTKRNHTIWQGYASGVFNEKTMQDERYLKRAVRTIFDQYRLFADGFLIENRRN